MPPGAQAVPGRVIVLVAFPAASLLVSPVFFPPNCIRILAGLAEKMARSALGRIPQSDSTPAETGISRRFPSSWRASAGDRRSVSAALTIGCRPWQTSFPAVLRLAAFTTMLWRLSSFEVRVRRLTFGNESFRVLLEEGRTMRCPACLGLTIPFNVRFNPLAGIRSSLTAMVIANFPYYFGVFQSPHEDSFFSDLRIGLCRDGEKNVSIPSQGLSFLTDGRRDNCPQALTPRQNG